MEKPFKKITLDNGLRMILIPKESSFAATVLVLVEAGSKYETKELNGISHFLEHMCFKGTERRPRSIDIASELEGIGAAYNAFTVQEYTGYYAKSEPGHFGKIFDIVSDIYLNQVFNEDEIEKEKRVIIEEINMYEDMPMRQVDDVFMELLYGDQPAGWDVAGKKDVILKINREDLAKYRSDHYLGESTIVVVSGKFDEDEAVDLAKKSFDKIGVAGKKQKIKTIEKQDKPEVKIKFKETDQAHLVLGARAFDVFNEKKYALDILAEILGGGMGSRLFQRVREEMGAAYYISAESQLFTDHGYLAVSAGADKGRIGAVTDSILQEFRRISDEPVLRGEFNRALEHLVGNMMLGLETSNSLAGFYGGQEVVTGEILTPEETVQKYRKVTPLEVQSVAREILRDDKLNLAVIGPFKGQTNFLKTFKLP